MNLEKRPLSERTPGLTLEGRKSLRSAPALATTGISGLGALRFRDFRLYWIGYVISVSGQQMLFVAQGWLIYELTGSKLLLGAVGLAQAVPATVLTFFGGVVASGACS